MHKIRKSLRGGGEVQGVVLMGKNSQSQPRVYYTCTSSTDAFECSYGTSLRATHPLGSPRWASNTCAVGSQSYQRLHLGLPRV